MAIAAENKKLHPARIVIAVVIGIILLVIAISLYYNSHAPKTPAQPVQQLNPNTSRNTPPGGTVSQGSNPDNAATPSPNGTNGNPMSSQ